MRILFMGTPDFAAVFRHIVQQVMQPPVKFCHRAADLCQTLVALFYDLS